MEGTIGEVRMFAANFAPKTWALCQGQLMPINTNQALFAILGTTYGGNGVNNFALPDLRSRAQVGAGQGIGLSAYVNGEQVGTETVTLLQAQIPSHTHIATVGAATGTSANGSLKASLAGDGQSNPGGNFLGNPTGQGVTEYATSGTPVAMASGSVTVSVTGGPQMGALQVGTTGQSQPHANLQPYLAINYIICLNGIFPSRD